MVLPGCDSVVNKAVSQISRHTVWKILCYVHKGLTIIVRPAWRPFSDVYMWIDHYHSFFYQIHLKQTDYPTYLELTEVKTNEIWPISKSLTDHDAISLWLMLKPMVSMMVAVSCGWISGSWSPERRRVIWTSIRVVHAVIICRFMQLVH